MSSSYTPPRVGTKSFSLVTDAFLQAEGLPFQDVLTEAEIDAAFAAENVRFGEGDDDIYTPALTLWGWLSQTLHSPAWPPPRRSACMLKRSIATSPGLG